MKETEHALIPFVGNFKHKDSGIKIKDFMYSLHRSDKLSLQ